MRQTNSDHHSQRLAKWEHVEGIAALVVATSLAFSSGVIAGNAAAGDESHATGTFLSGNLLDSLTPEQLLLLGTAAANNDGTQATQTVKSDLDATILNALILDIPGGLQIPVTLADVGALASFARAEANGSSLGASGLVTNDGAIGVGAVGPGGVPSPMTLDLTDILGAGFTSEIANLQLELQSISASAESVAAGTPVGDYEIIGTKLYLTSPTIDGISDLLTGPTGPTADLSAAVNALTGSGGSLVGGILAAVQTTLGLGVLELGTATASVTVDLPGVIAPLLVPTTSNGVTVDLMTGEITVDLAVLNGGSLNGLAPNSEILSAAVLSGVTAAVTTIVSDLVDDVTAAVTTALDNAVVAIDVDLNLLGVPLINITVDGTIAQIVGGTSTIGITALGIVPIGAITQAVIEAALTPILNAVTDPVTGDLATFVTALQTDVLNPVLTGLNPVLEALDTVLSLIANAQVPSPPVQGALFTETALEVRLLAQGPIGSLLELDVARASVGPNTTGVAPVITSLVPDNGPESGGTTVTITGTGFAGTTGVLFGATPATSFTVDSDTQITAVSPAHVPATVGVTLLHPAGTSNPGDFTFTPLISITDLDPNFGPTAGGTLVDIFGTCFLGATGVTFGGLAGTSFAVIDNTHIQVVTPAHAAGAVDVIVQGSIACGGSASFPNGFTYVPAGVPTITGIVPDNGPESGGTAVTITGTGFTGATGVTFGGVAGASVVVVNDTTITVTTPPHAPGLVGVIVQHPSGNSGPFDFTFTPLIAVTSIVPDFGPEAGGTVVTITGACFTGATGVTFDGVAGTAFTVDSDTQITVTTPPGTGLVDVVVQGSVACGGDKVVPDGFQYIQPDAPVIVSLTPNHGPFTGGTHVTVSGSGFTGATSVTFDGVAGTSFTVINDTTITVVTPPHAIGLVDAVVHHPTNGPSAPLGYTYLPATTVIGVDPGTGPEAGGTTVTITGTCFTGATGVLFGTTAARSFRVVNDTTIIAVSPPGVGTVDVTVTGSITCGSATRDNAFRYVRSGLSATGVDVLPLVLTAGGLLLAGAALVVGIALVRRRRNGSA
jgi:hypothetical protein